MGYFSICVFLFINNKAEKVNDIKTEQGKMADKMKLHDFVGDWLVYFERPDKNNEDNSKFR